MCVFAAKSLTIKFAKPVRVAAIALAISAHSLVLQASVGAAANLHEV